MDKKVIVFDIDGTLSNGDHRVHYVSSKPKNWKAYLAGAGGDLPHDDRVALAKQFKGLGHTIVISSGRPDDIRDITIKWLADHGIEYDGLYMRAAGDYRPDDVIKLELLADIRKDHGEPFIWFDDRNRVVKALRDNGVFVIQVAEGDF